MWIRELFAGLLGFASGLAVAGGMFALLIALGVISRFAGKTHTAAYVIHYESAAALGGSSEICSSVYQFRLPIGLPVVIAFGLFSGVVQDLGHGTDGDRGCSAGVQQKVRLKTGMPWLILSMALGRAAGAWMHAYFGYGW